ncbi:MAG: DUF4870 domain-containing protein [Pyrinomonadaceae bacterium]|nr:DUF4870 domain-containing protein [Pyrinomonadaceae bacterium]
MENYSATGKSAIGLDANVAAALGYIIGILGLINFLIEKENKFVKFHGIQSVIYLVGIGAVFTVLWIVLVIFAVILGAISDILGLVMWLINAVLFLAFFLAMFGGLIYAAYKAYQGQMFKLPIIGNIAEKII